METPHHFTFPWQLILITTQRNRCRTGTQIFIVNIFLYLNIRVYLAVNDWKK